MSKNFKRNAEMNLRGQLNNKIYLNLYVRGCKKRKFFAAFFMPHFAMRFLFCSFTTGFVCYSLFVNNAVKIILFLLNRLKICRICE